MHCSAIYYSFSITKYRFCQFQYHHFCIRAYFFCMVVVELSDLFIKIASRPFSITIISHCICKCVFCLPSIDFVEYSNNINNKINDANFNNMKSSWKYRLFFLMFIESEKLWLNETFKSVFMVAISYLRPLQTFIIHWEIELCNWRWFMFNEIDIFECGWIAFLIKTNRQFL